MRYVLEVDVWEGRTSQPVTVEEPSLDQVEKWLKQLDGKRVDSLVIHSITGHEFVVGGGMAGELVASILDGERSLDLANGTPDQTIVTIPVGGQDGEYPRCLVVDYATVFQAAKYFLQTPSPDPSLSWEES